MVDDVVRYTEDGEGLQVHVSQRFLIGAQITILTLIVGSVGYPLVNASSSKARHDPFTGTQGAALRAEHEQLREDFDEFIRYFEDYKTHHHDFALESVKEMLHS